MGKKYICSSDSCGFQVYFAHMDNGFITLGYIFILQINVKTYVKTCCKFNPFPKLPECTAHG